MTTSFVDPLIVLDRNQEPNHSLRGFLAGGSAFLLGGGPSSRLLDLNKLKSRGIWSMAVNNMAGSFHANSFICADPPSKFHHGIWLDPTVMKFVPTPKMNKRRNHLREKVGEEFTDLIRNGKQISVTDCPNVWGYGRRAWLQTDDTFFTDPEAAWGNHNAGVEQTGLEKAVCSLFLAIRVLYYLGSRTIYLVGVDWKMSPTAQPTDNYAFKEFRGPVKKINSKTGKEEIDDSIIANNHLYKTCGPWFQALQDNGTFAKFGLKIYNCNQFSSLRAFPHVPFDTAIDQTLKGFPKEPFDLQDWYKK